MKISALTSFACFAVLVSGAIASGGGQKGSASSAQLVGTPAPTTAKVTVLPDLTAGKSVATPAPTTAKAPATPPPTTGKGAATPASSTAKIPNTSALITGQTASTPAPTTTKQAVTKITCVNISVKGDATYCIPRPICSGGGKAPTGVNCPKKSDVAVESCFKTLKSYADGGKCVAPVDAECQVIKTGAWGCVWKGAEPSGASSGKTPVAPASTAVKAPSAPADKTSGPPASIPAKTVIRPVSTPTPVTGTNAVTPASTTMKAATVTPSPTTSGKKNVDTPAPGTTKVSGTATPIQPREQAQQHNGGHAKESKSISCL